MSKAIRLLSVLLLLACSAAHATLPKIKWEYQAYANAPWVSSAAAACVAQASNETANSNTYNFAFTGVVYNQGPEYATGCNRTLTYKSNGKVAVEGSYVNITRRSVAPYCMPHSSPSGDGCACDTGYEQGSGVNAGQCVPTPCSSGRVVSSGFYDTGAAIATGPLVSVCDNGCSAAFDGMFPEGSALVGGVKHYFAKGSYVQTGGRCNAGGGPGSVPSATDAVPPDNCAAGESAGVVNGKGVCAPNMENGPDPSTPGTPKPADPPKSDDKKSSDTTIETAKNADGSKTVTTTTVTKNVDGTSSKTVTTDKYDKDGNKTGSESTTTGTAVTKEAGDKADEAKRDKCEKNSSDTGCGGDPKAVNGAELYKAKTDTVKGILSGAKDNLLSSPIGSAAGNFFSVSGGGSCPTVSGRIPFIDKVVVFDMFCTQFAMVMLLTIKGVLLLLATWWAFRIAIE